MLVQVLFFLPILYGLTVTYPESISRVYYHNRAQFGSSIGLYNLSISLSSPENACEPFNLTGNRAFSCLVIALRGGCSAETKAYHAQLAGAKGIIIGNNQINLLDLPSYAPGEGLNVTISVVSVSSRTFVTLQNAILKGQVLANLDDNGLSPLDIDLSGLDTFRSLFYAILLIPCVWIFLLLIYFVHRRYVDFTTSQARQRRIVTLPIYTYEEVSGNDRINGSLTASVMGSIDQVRIHNQECCICLEPFVPQSEIKVFPCAHGFHVLCIDPWIQSNDVCPVCRAVLRD